MPIIIGDIHGCFATLMALLKKLPEDRIILTGDLIDRGPRSKEVVQWALDHRDICRSVKGNHEQMLLNALTTFDPNNFVFPSSTRNEWIREGGKDTLRSYGDEGFEGLPEEHIKFLCNLPLYIEEEDLIISHSSYSGMYPWDKVAEYAETPFGILWNRNYFGYTYEMPKKFHVFGHTPYPEPVIEKTFADIDTGAVYSDAEYKAAGFGKLTALIYPTMEVIQQENIDV